MGNSQQRPRQSWERQQQIAVKQSEQYDRIEGKQIHMFPYKSIGALKCQNPANSSQTHFASGVLLSKNLILTSAHAIYNKRQKEINTRFKFYTEPDGTAHDYYEIQSLRYQKQFQQCQPYKKLQFDYALIKLKEDLAMPINYKDFPTILLTCQKCFSSTQNVTLKIYGYPNEYEDNFRLLSEGGMKLFQYGYTIRNRVRIIDHKNFIISYGINTSGGQSGCPIILKDHIIGIHNGGQKKTNVNVGRLITAELVRNIVQWGKQMGGEEFTVRENNCRHCRKELKKMGIVKQDRKSQRISMRQSAQQPFDTDKTQNKTTQIENKPLNEKQKEYEKSMQIKATSIQHIVEQLKHISLEEKSKTTQLILKATWQHWNWWHDNDNCYEKDWRRNHPMEQFSECLSQFTMLQSFSFYARLPLLNWKEFHQLKDSLNKLNLQKIQIIIDPDFQQKQQKKHWAEEWMEQMSQDRIVKYQKWDWS